MLIVHHLGISQSDRIVWLCEELGLPYELRRYERQGGAPPEYAALTPYGTAPVIQDGDLTLSESGAIIEYLIHRHGGGRLAVAPGEPNYPDYLFWFHYANGSLMASVLMSAALDMTGAPIEGTVKHLYGRAERGFQAVEARLGEAAYFAGDEFTAADIIMFFPLTTMRMFSPRDITPYPNLRAYLARVAQRPAYQRAMAKADPGLAPKID